MPLLRKTGVRSPWMPAPLQGSLERGRQALVVAAIVPAVLLGGNAQFIGRLPRSEDTTRPARPTAVVQRPVPIPGALMWMPRPLAPNTDPLHPPIVVADPPDPTLVQPSAAFVGRLPRDEDTSRPARPAPIQRGAQPHPGAISVQTAALRDQVVAQPDRLARTALVSGQQPQPQALALPVGAARATPTDRVAITRVWSGVQPVPRAAVWWGRVPFFAAVSAVFAPGTISGPGPDGWVRASDMAGTVESPRTSGAALGPDVDGTTRSPNTTGTMNG